MFLANAAVCAGPVVAVVAAPETLVRTEQPTEQPAAARVEAQG